MFGCRICKNNDQEMFRAELQTVDQTNQIKINKENQLFKKYI